nr:T9SS type A sorting domain-containing protein [Bacteroidales bacterium]
FLSKQIEPSNQVRPGSSGTKSVRMWPKSVMGVTANGNLTCGRMNAGSMSASGSNNYNYTQRSDDRFSTPLTTVPDSLTVWVCFRSASADQNARARALVHGDADLREVANGTLDPNDKLVASAMATFKRTSPANGAYTWRRLSVPFVHNGPCNDPRYILFTITTNEIPGEGGTSDDMFVDDVLLIYNPSIRMGAIPQNQFIIGEELTIPFTLTGTMSPENLNEEPNQVIAQLSAANGSFSTPTELGRVTTNTSGSLTVTIPQGIFSGEHYRIRLVTTNYPMVSEDNGFDITISTNDAVAENEINEVPFGVELYDLSGRPVSNGNLAPGIYVARYRSNNGYRFEKFLKR